MKKIIIFGVSFLVTCVLCSQVFAKSDGEFSKELKAAASDDEKIVVLEAWGNSGNKGSKISDKVISEVLKNGESSKLRRIAAQTLGKLGIGRTSLEAAFKNDDKYVRQNAIEALAMIGDKKSAGVFREGYKVNDNPDIKYWALIGLSKSGTKQDVAIFRNALNSEWVQQDAFEIALAGLGQYGSKSDWRYIKGYCLKLNEPQMIAGLKAAGKLQINDALPIIERNMANANINIARAALEALGNFKGYDIISTLIRFKHAHPADPNIAIINQLFKKNNAASQYAILKSNMNLRSEANDNKKENIIGVISKNSVVQILTRGKRKYIITEKSTGQELEDFWYQIKTESGKKGYVFGAYIDIVDTTK